MYFWIGNHEEGDWEETSFDLNTPVVHFTVAPPTSGTGAQFQAISVLISKLRVNRNWMEMNEAHSSAGDTRKALPCHNLSCPFPSDCVM